ncbi:DUF6088 family protein [Geopseudomonas sagittaria]|uniref:DUF6088 family protein n=1 Tax=Geopseudomonas sagittaria TaxID=1135990 RepID=UPI000B80E86C|nr:DUF6088 family protein [Pseudomonas sagittaria]
MPIASTIWQQVKYLPKGRPFSSRRFAGLGSRSAVGKAIARLVIAGELERITRGIYMRPKISPYVGRVRPSALAVIRVIAKQNHETIQVHGAEAVRAFHLSTQMQTQPVLYTSGSSREIRIGALTIRLRHVSPEKLQHAGTKVGLALVALFYLGRKGVNSTSVTKIKSELTSAELKQLAACKMPAWMSKALAGPPPA